MFRRRRPLLRTAAVGGGAYYAGKKRAEHQAADSEQESGQRNPEGQQQAAPAQPAPSTGPVADQLRQLASLHDSGALTDDEFAAAKSKLLGT